MKYYPVPVPLKSEGLRTIKNSHKCMQTKRQMSAALKVLLNNRSDKKISVNDLARQANLTRNTFYNHFETISSLAEWTISDGIKSSGSEGDEVTINSVFQFLIRDKEYIQKVANYYGEEWLRGVLDKEAIRPFLKLISDYAVEYSVVQTDRMDDLYRFARGAVERELIEFALGKTNGEEDNVILYIKRMLRIMVRGYREEQAKS